MSFRNDNFSDIYNKSTPPPKVKVRNPFDRVLIERLHKPICSPGMCKIYKKKNRGSFRWEIDQTCTLVPADIVACSSQFEPSPDPALEKIAEEANEKFFSQEMVMPSPLESSKKIKPLLQSFESSVQTTSIESIHTKVTKDVSAQTILTFPAILPPEIEKLLEPYCNYSEENDMFEEYEVTANGSLRRKLFFEEQSDADHNDSEHTDDEIYAEQRPPSNCESHTPVVFSPDELSNDFVSRGMKRTFGTPLQNRQSRNKPRNKILDVVDFGEPCFSPIEFQTPTRCENSTTSSSLASASISPVTKAISSDEEKNHLTSPECEAMATCLECFDSESSGEKKKCFCKYTPNKSSLMRSTSLKDSPHKSRRGSLLREKRSLSMSSLHRSRSVQKLDFSMDMSIDVSMHNSFHADSESSPIDKAPGTWSLEEDQSIQSLVKIESLKNKSDVQSSTKLHHMYALDETPIKGSKRYNVLAHEISKMRNVRVSPEKMSLDSSLDNFDIPSTMEDRKIDFNKVDLKFLTENISQVEYNSNFTKVTNDTTTSFKRVDSGFNENTFSVNASSYYESAIKPSELTVTNVSKCETKTALREISNLNWMRVDSGFKDDTSGDSMQFYPESSVRKATGNELKFHDKENMEDFDKLFQAPIRGETMSMSDIFNDDMTFNCNFSSTPSKNKNRKATS